MTPTEAAATQEATDAIIFQYGKDPILCARQLFPHWFPRPMPWVHRGMVAILLRRADFLLKFSEPGRPEQWADGSRHWTKKDLAKIVRHFRYKVNPADPKSPLAPIFRVRYAEDGRTPVGIDMVLGTHVAIIIPRGFSKTTIINFCNVFKTLYKMTKFTVYISESTPHAEDQLATIKRELSSNEPLIALFGKLKPERTDDETWGAKGFETTTGVKFAAKGRGAQIRGLNKFGDRPDTLVLDDVEDKESVSTEPQREKALSWFKGDVSEALPRNREGYIYIVGTILHPKAILPSREKDPDYTTVRFGAAVTTGLKDAKGQDILEPLWDDKPGLSLAQIEAKKQSFARDGKLYEFGLEIMSQARDELKLKFKKEYIRYATHKPTDFIARSIHIDPAISPKPGADYCCIAVVGLKENGQKHVCAFHAQRGMPFVDQAEMYFNMKIEWDCTHHSVESTAYQAALAQSIRELMFIKARAGYGTKAYFEITETWPHGRKVERVEGVLQPLMAAGYLTFQQIWPELEVMFLDWPNEKLDGPDCIAGAVSNLEPYAALSYGDSSALDRANSPDPDYIAPCEAGSSTVP